LSSRLIQSNPEIDLEKMKICPESPLWGLAGLHLGIGSMLIPERLFCNSAGSLSMVSTLTLNQRPAVMGQKWGKPYAKQCLSVPIMHKCMLIKWAS